MLRGASERTRGCEVFDAAWIARCVREQFRVAIAPYVLDGADSEAGTATQGKKVHGKRRASERLSSSSPAARTPKRACLRSSHDRGDGAKKEESVSHLDLAAKSRSLKSKQRVRG